ncbi:MAG TPA: tyrosine--tRNA ligase, partial [Acidobacteria bacterium]|nr:tyrosine--tRNA ligase [Acidobacteriota bacterium]
DPPNDMFGKVMSVSDDLMWSYYELLTDLSVVEIESMRTQVGAGELHPKRAKL